MVCLNEQDPKSELINKLTNFDPLDTAEKITGKDYHVDIETSNLGMALMMGRNQLRDKLLVSQDDVPFSGEIQNYIRVMKDLGFVIQLEEPFVGKSWHGEVPPNEVYYLAWHPTKFILAAFETYDSKDVNSASWYFNFKPYDFDTFWRLELHLSGSAYCGPRENELPKEEWSWIGHWDAREGIRNQMSNFDQFGTFVNPWPKDARIWLWLCNYMDGEKKKTDRDYSNYYIQTERRYNLLSKDIRDCINWVKPDLWDAGKKNE